jgi:hypothetical protein
LRHRRRGIEAVSRGDKEDRSPIREGCVIESAKAKSERVGSALHELGVTVTFATVSNVLVRAKRRQAGHRKHPLTPTRVSSKSAGGARHDRRAGKIEMMKTNRVADDERALLVVEAPRTLYWGTWGPAVDECAHDTGATDL